MTIDNRQIPPGPKSHKSETQLLMLSTNQRLKWFCNQQFCLNISCVELGREINKEVRLPKFLSDSEIASREIASHFPQHSANYLILGRGGGRGAVGLIRYIRMKKYDGDDF